MDETTRSPLRPQDTLDSDALDSLEQQIPQLAADAVRVAYQTALASGHGVVEAAGGSLFEVFADGTRRFVKRLDEPAQPPTPVARGSRLVLR